MSDHAKLFEQMMAQGQQMAQAMAPAFAEAMRKAQAQNMQMPTMPREVLEATMGQTFNPGGLDARTRLLVALGALVAQGAQAEAAIETTVDHALEAGARPQEVAEVIAQMAAFGGVPAMTRAMGLAQGVIARRSTGESGK